MIVKDIVCNQFDVNVGAGEFVGKNVYSTDEAELKVGAGHICMNGKVDKLLEVTCSMGGVEVTLANNENEFNYEIEAMAGSVQIGGQEYSSLLTGNTIDNNASGKIDIECSMGAVDKNCAQSKTKTSQSIINLFLKQVCISESMCFRD